MIPLAVSAGLPTALVQTSRGELPARSAERQEFNDLLLYYGVASEAAITGYAVSSTEV